MRRLVCWLALTSLMTVSALASATPYGQFGWRAVSPREEIRPGFSVEPISGVESS